MNINFIILVKILDNQKLILGESGRCDIYEIEYWVSSFVNYEDRQSISVRVRSSISSMRSYKEDIKICISDLKEILFFQELQ